MSDPNPISPIPTDPFSRRRRELSDDPGTLRAGSTIPLQDFYGYHQSWIVETFRQDGKETVFIIVSDAEQGRRFMLPPEVTAALYRQREQLVARARKIGAQQAVATRRSRGDRLGNTEALRKAHRARTAK